MAKAEPGRREARKASTREALLKAGRALFAAGAVDAVSIDAVVAAAGVSKGSFYNHFVDRNALAEAVAGSIRADLHAEVERVNAGEDDAARRIARAVCVFLRYALHDPEGAAALARIHGGAIASENPQNRPLVADIRGGLASGRLNIPTLDSGVMLVIGVVQAGMLSILAEPGPALAVAKAQQLAMLILRALGVDTAEAERIAAQSAEQVVRADIPSEAAA
jgi:AcrR family transcriptional regulator